MAYQSADPTTDRSNNARKSSGSRLRRLFESEREVQFSRQDQLTVAGIGHGLILVGVTLILLFSFDRWPGGSALLLFYSMEGVIVASGLASVISARQVVDVLDNWFNMNRAEEWINDNRKLKVQGQNAALILLFVLQFGSMAALLVATSGPIESPFAPMALAIGVFTPFIVNRGSTIALIILTTMAFYVVMIMVVGSGGDESTPDAGAYAAVNLFILLLASVLTFKQRRDDLSFTLKRTVEAPPERVWRAWTDPLEVANWVKRDGEHEPEISMDVSKDGFWRAAFNGRGSQPGVPWSGKYLEVEPPKRLVFTVGARSGIGEEIISVELKPRGEWTEIVVTQTDHGRFDGLKKGWERFMSRMDGYLLSHDDSRPRDGSD
jgi:uncharacterized protein YndB with AHSA1/START domain